MDMEFTFGPMLAAALLLVGALTMIVVWIRTRRGRLDDALLTAIMTAKVAAQSSGDLHLTVYDNDGIIRLSYADGQWHGLENYHRFFSLSALGQAVSAIVCQLKELEDTTTPVPYLNNGVRQEKERVRCELFIRSWMNNHLSRSQRKRLVEAGSLSGRPYFRTKFEALI